MKTLEEFISYYKETNRFILPIVNYSKKPLTDKQLESKYKEYCKKVEKQNEKREEKMIDNKIKMYEKMMNGENGNKSEYANDVEETMKNVHEKNDISCYRKFYDSLEHWQKKILDDNLWLCPKKNRTYVFDGCHILDRGKHSKLADDEDNIVLLPRYLHKCLDDYINPFTSKIMKKEEHDNLWICIIGEERWNRLLKKSIN